MSSAAYLRQYYQVRASQDVKGQPHEATNYNQTVKIMSEMIAFIKRLLEKVATIKGIFQNQEFGEATVASDKAIQELKQIQLEIQSRFTPNNGLDQKMAGPFTFRLCKEMNYWRFVLPFVLNLILDIQNKFEQQKKTELYSLDCIFTFASSSIDRNANQLIKSLRRRKLQKEKEKEKIEQEKSKDEISKDNQNMQDIDRYIKELKRSQKERKSAELIEQYHLKEKAKEKAALKKRILVLEMDSYIYKLYKGLGVMSMEPIDQYCCDLTEQQNTDIMLREQKIRNRKVRKDIKNYTSCYSKFAKKTISRLSIRPNILMRRDSSKINHHKEEVKSSQTRKREVTFHKEPESSALPIKTNLCQLNPKEKRKHVDHNRMGRSLTISHHSQSLKKLEKKEASKQKNLKPKRRQLIEITNKKQLKIIR